MFAVAKSVVEAVANSGPPTRKVQCYHCREQVAVASKALTLTCPLCSRAIKVDDFVIRGERTVNCVRTCGALVIKPRARFKGNLVEARAGADINGVLDCNVVCGGAVIIGPKAIWKGDCTAQSIVIKPGATILGGRFEVKPAA